MKLEEVCCTLPEELEKWIVVGYHVTSHQLRRLLYPPPA